MNADQSAAAERWRLTDSIFREAAKLKGKKRLAYLEKACAGDLDLRAEVESLLSYDTGDGPLDKPAVQLLNSVQLASAVDGWSLPGEGHPDAAPPIGSQAGLQEESVGQPMAAEDFVVGWLVCVKGAHSGESYKLRRGVNRIGRGKEMDICIPGDKRISRENHALISYDPGSNRFHVHPGHSRGVVYLNNSLVEAATALEAYDMIEIGQSGLQFVPFCGERFEWR
jgi:hypothetical protein